MSEKDNDKLSSTAITDIDITVDEEVLRPESIMGDDGEEYEPLPVLATVEIPNSPLKPTLLELHHINPYSSAYRCSQHGITAAITGGNSVYIPKADFTVKVTDAIRQASRGSLNPYIYTIEAKHGDFSWTIKRRYKHFNDLHDRLQAFRVATKIPIPTKKHRERRKTMKVGKDHFKIPHFPKRPEATIKEEGLAKRRQQLEAYINSVVQSNVYRKHSSTKKFFEISKFSFIKDLGEKSKEGIVEKQTGSHKVALSFLGRCCPCFDFRKSNFALRWADRWFVVKDTFIAYLNAKKPDIVTGVFLFDCSTKVEVDIHHSNHLFLTNQSRKMKINCWTQRKAVEWKEEIEKRIIKYSEDLTSSMIKHSSFAPPRPDSYVHWFVDGRSYMDAVADAMEKATEEIFITDWFLSPQVYLKRPIGSDDSWRLDKTLHRKAKQGVKIYILLWKEIQAAVPIDSAYSKAHLTSLHPNINLMRHPDFAPDQTLWAHHEKIVVIDQSIAFIGGIDLCYGRWDDHLHRLTDVDPNPKIQTPSTNRKMTEEEKPGNGPNVHGMPSTLGMMGILAVGLIEQAGQGPTNVDQEKTSPKKEEKYEKKKLNIKTGKIAQRLKSMDLRRKKPTSHSFKDSADGKLNYTYSSDEEESEAVNSCMYLKKYQEMVHHVTSNKSVLWPGKDYYNMMIKDFYDLRNPFSDSLDRNHQPRVPWHDIASVTYGKAARDAARHFIQRWNFTKLQKKREKETLQFLLPKTYSDASFMYLNSNPHLRLSQAIRADVQVLRSSCEWSAGIYDPDQSIQNAYLYAIKSAQHYIYIENQFFITMIGSQRVYNGICEALYNKIVESHEAKRRFCLYVVMPLIPGFEGDLSNPAASRSIRVMLYYQFKSICRGPNSLLHRLNEKIGSGAWLNYVSFCGLRQHDELNGVPITEIIYVHSKMLIVDDRITIIGSANVNDRSMAGDRDSEVAIIVEDTQFVDSTMAGKPYKVGIFSSSLRRRVFSEHLGLLPQDDGTLKGYDPLTYKTSKPIDDVACEKFFKEVWVKTAAINTSAYDKVFRCVPADTIRHSSSISTYTSNRLVDEDIDESRKELQNVCGNLVLLPLNFLSDEDILPAALSPEGVLRLADTFL